MKVVVCGAGQMSPAIVTELLQDPLIEEITVADCHKKALKKTAERFSSKKIRTVVANIEKSKELRKLLRDATCVIGATTYKHNVLLTQACIQEGAHLCDLGGNNAVVREQHTYHAKARQKGVTIIPDCGLAPGMVNILAYHAALSFDHVQTLHIRVGGLPQQPSNLLKYQLAFSVQGLINEYIEPVDIVVNGKKKTVPGMSGIEPLDFGTSYPALEAFYTSGGISTLPKSLRGHVDTMDYKTIRYPGHAQHIQLLMDLGLFSSKPLKIEGKKTVPRAWAAHTLTEYLPHGQPDVVLIRIDVQGTRNKQNHSVRMDCVDVYNTPQQLSAMQRTTGFSIALVAKMLVHQKISKTGVVPQELAVDGESFMQGLKAAGIVFNTHTSQHV
jgi:lysine 6-dehydrogenase